MKDSPFLILLCLFLILSSCAKHAFFPWLLIENKNGDFGYVNQSGDTVIALGKYAFCYSDTFKTYGVVFHKKEGIVAIDRKEKILFKVFSYDNGPDYPSEGLFRIISDGNIGYANLNGDIVIEPKYSCAYPFNDGKAKVSLECTDVSSGEHLKWESKSWKYIDKGGNIIR